MKTYGIGAVALLSLAATNAYSEAANSDYAEVSVGVVPGGDFHATGIDSLLGPVNLGEKLRTGWTASALYGRQIGQGPVSFEAEGVYLNDAIKSDDLNAVLGTSAGLRANAYGGLVNMKIEAPLGQAFGWQISPFVTGGAGYGHNSISILGADYAGAGVMWQGKVGLAMRLSPKLAWDVSYRYLHLPTFDTNKLGLAARMETRAQSVSLGLRYAFGS